MNAKIASTGAIGTLKQKMGNLKSENDALRDENEDLKKQIQQKEADYQGVS